MGRRADKEPWTWEDCEPGCQFCPFEGTCDGPPDLCPDCGLAVPYTGFVPEGVTMCECESGVRDRIP